MKNRLEACVRAIDAENSRDPVTLVVEGVRHPQAQIEGERAQAWVEKLRPGASDALRLAARAHHIRRWEVPRDSYPRTRDGYLDWRRRLYSFHGEALAGIMAAHGYGEEVIERARTILRKERIKTDADVQAHEDAVSVAFLEVRAGTFAPTVSDEQLLRALRRTWVKMSPAGRDAARTLDLAPAVAAAVAAALE